MHLIVLLCLMRGRYLGAGPRHRRIRFYNRCEYTADEPKADDSDNISARDVRSNRRLILHRESCYTSSVIERLIHEIIPVGMLQCNCSILGDAETREAIVVDPGDEVERILEILREHRLNVRAIVSTHTHIDHVGGLARLHAAMKAPVLIHEADLELYRHLDMQAQFLGMRTPESMRIEDFVKEGDSLRWGGYAARVIHTPGHTPGSISLLVEKGLPDGDAHVQRARPQAAKASAEAHLHAHLRGHAGEAAPSQSRESGTEPGRLVAGDTLFQGSIGRTDLWGGSMKDILSSIREKLLSLPDETLVIPGHGESTTIGTERAENPYLR
jgi:hydroxyacylglutathione hydrolase